jgi:hypothetical protein
MLRPMTDHETLPEGRVCPVDPERLVEELRKRAPFIEEQVRRLEEAKKVSRKTMQLVMTM